jgi:hypothetical protein
VSPFRQKATTGRFMFLDWRYIVVRSALERQSPALTVLGQAGGSLTANVAPLPGSEITRSVPPIRSTSSREM